MVDKLTVITEPENFSGERALVELMLRRGVDRVHVRKRRAEDAEALIAEIAPEFHGRLRVHYYPELASRYGCEMHLRERSCHSVDELREDVEYQFLSPIYDSISKEGYKSRFDLAELRVGGNVIALGGVTPEHFGELRAAGFGGAAMIGYIWADHKEETIKERIDAAIYNSYKFEI